MYISISIIKVLYHIKSISIGIVLKTDKGKQHYRVH